MAEKSHEELNTNCIPVDTSGIANSTGLDAPDNNRGDLVGDPDDRALGTVEADDTPRMMCRGDCFIESYEEEGGHFEWDQVDCPNSPPCELARCPNYLICNVELPQCILDNTGGICGNCSVMIGRVQFTEGKPDEECPVCFASAACYVTYKCGHNVCTGCYRVETPPNSPLPRDFGGPQFWYESEDDATYDAEVALWHIANPDQSAEFIAKKIIVKDQRDAAADRRALMDVCPICRNTEGIQISSPPHNAPCAHMPGHFANECPMSGAMVTGRAGGTLKRAATAGPYVIGRPKPGPYILGVPGKAGGATGGLNRGVYVLEMHDRRLYVGKSSNIAERIRQHQHPEGAAVCAAGFWRRIDPVTPYSDDFESWERAETLTRMRTLGIDMVRGWQYTTKILSVAQKEHAREQICEKFDLCRRCGYKGHFADACGAKVRRLTFGA